MMGIFLWFWRGLEIGLSRWQNDTSDVVVYIRREQDVKVVMEVFRKAGVELVSAPFPLGNLVHEAMLFSDHECMRSPNLHRPMITRNAPGGKLAHQVIPPLFGQGDLIHACVGLEQETVEILALGARTLRDSSSGEVEANLRAISYRPVLHLLQKPAGELLIRWFVEGN
jgi:hypothetical protein